MKQLFEELTVSDYLKNVYNKQGMDNTAFIPDNNPDTVIDLPATVVTAAPMGGEGYSNGTLAHGGTATPTLGMDLSYLLPVVQQHHHHHLRKVSVKHSVATPWVPPHCGSVEGKELNILRGALLQNKLPGGEMVRD
jgi:hypothetical protein